MLATIAFLAVIALIAIGVPIALAFAGMTVIMAWMYSIDASSLMTMGFWSVNSFVLMALPFFIMAGYVMSASGIAASIVKFVDSIVGQVRGAHGAVLVLTCAVFGAAAGTATAAVASIGTVMIKPMEERGYPREYTSALLGISSLLGILIPPSITMLLYAVVTKQSVAACFLSTVFPAVLLVVLLCIVNAFMTRSFDTRSIEIKTPSQSWPLQVSRNAISAAPALLMPFIILGGIYSGIFTPTEASAVAVAYVIPIAVFLYKMAPGRLITSLSEAAATTGVIILIILFSLVTGRIFILEGIPQQLTEFISATFENRIMILIFVNVMLIALGIILDDVILTIVVAPLLLPTMEGIGIHPVQFGAIVGTSVVIAANSPPTAPILYMACRIGNVKMKDVMKPALTFMVFAALPVQLATSYWPPLSLYLPELFGYLK